MATTPVYGFPFLEPPDAPDIAAATENLAQAVEDELVLRNPQAATAVLASQYTLTSTITDLSGCVINLTTPRAGAKALVTWTADCQLVTAGAASLYAVINLAVDGSDVAFPQSVWGPGNWAAQANTRGAVAGATIVTLASAGSHQLKLRAAKSSATGDMRLNAQHTSISAVVFP
ncbi:hypothetical protein ACFOOK_28040 [Micromonospora krabiensis]|uniref:Uncharacterized protein n=1 Tax=Micromonospora krabiensis TaxID=307121 RepID=A0A1C3N4R5_9ACTN|nr:hypothetical protein [Micromonospora krabiensis]SBV27580.1 hypothetical protein GA0070620_3104 [Micromonospora krabiensis]